MTLNSPCCCCAIRIEPSRSVFGWLKIQFLIFKTFFLLLFIFYKLRVLFVYSFFFEKKTPDENWQSRKKKVYPLEYLKEAKKKKNQIMACGKHSYIQRSLSKIFSFSSFSSFGNFLPFLLFFPCLTPMMMMFILTVKCFRIEWNSIQRWKNKNKNSCLFLTNKKEKMNKFIPGKQFSPLLCFSFALFCFVLFCFVFEIQVKNLFCYFFVKIWRISWSLNVCCKDAKETLKKSPMKCSEIKIKM